MFPARSRKGDGKAVTLFRLDYVTGAWICVLFFASAVLADLRAPADVAVRDSMSAATDKGSESLRQTEYGGYALSRRTLNWSSMIHWKTEWQTPRGDRDRIRQDGKWYSGISRGLWASTEWWAATEGEHFDDRPSGTDRSGSTTRVQILRAGSGLTVRPADKLKLQAAAGGIEDSRIGRVERGLGLWSKSTVDEWNLGGYLQSLDLKFNRETPTNHRNDDLVGSLRVYKEYSPGNSNEVRASGSRLERDIYLDQLGTLSRRTEDHLDIRNVLNYNAGGPLQFSLSGELIHDRTEQTQVSADITALETNQAAFEAVTNSVYRRTTSKFSAGVRTVTQTIRSEILQGVKTNLSWDGDVKLPDRSVLGFGLAATKYTLDTRSEDNHDDRDELKYVLESRWAKPIGNTLYYQLRAAVQLDHLVYIHREFSANNRWTRLLTLQSVMRYAPATPMTHFIRAGVSTNYQDYDFEFDPRTTRSTVHRRLAISDSVSWRLSYRWAMMGTAFLQLEDFGRLYWESFEELRSDQVKSRGWLAEFHLRIGRWWKAGAGAIWDSRKSERFEPDKSNQPTVYQHLRAYGPTFLLECRPPSKTILRVRGRMIRQLLLVQEDRWILSGDAILAWQL